ncbi:MAG: S-methyl-5-thioribose-1-phosphate isomerase [Desulfobacterota bacterium]|nr:S-methyl-5-thioribose-1-phosphate isomerase [Thermodesulfobacteriota bacterium]
MADTVQSIIWRGDHVAILDQRLLPTREVYLECRTCEEVATAIRTLAVRGAPAIGIAAAMGLALAGCTSDVDTPDELIRRVHAAAEQLLHTRPTAVNLQWALTRMLRHCHTTPDATVASMRQMLIDEALRIQHEDIENNRMLGRTGAHLISDGATVMTICNTGSLATGGFGTALGVIRAAAAEGKRVTVVACETRPLLQGSRLTAWELRCNRIPYLLITDSMAAWYMRTHRVDLVIAGADRIAANGDVANKIGTYGLAVLAAAHQVPFVIAAPCATFDLTIESADGIPLEERSADEVRTMAGISIAPSDAPVWNPAFDIVPHSYIHAIITERGIIHPPFQVAIQNLCS